VGAGRGCPGEAEGGRGGGAIGTPGLTPGDEAPADGAPWCAV
jgi:hypothetical protein